MARRRRKISSEPESDPHKLKTENNNKTPPLNQLIVEQVNPLCVQKLLQSCVEEVTSTLDKLLLKMEASEERIVKMLETKIASLESQVKEVVAKNITLENKIQQLEKDKRKRNIVITGLNADKEDVANIVEKLMANPADERKLARIKDVWKTQLKDGSFKFIGTCDSFEEKQRILKCKRQMVHNGKPFYLDDDLTKEEREIQFKARMFARQYGGKGSTAVGYRKVWIDGICHEYNNKTETFEI